MSLISEALKKAHLEAVRQERQTFYRFRFPGSVDFPAQSRASKRRLIAIIVLSNVSVVLLAAAAVFFVIRGREASANAAPAVQSALASPAPASVPAAAVETPLVPPAEPVAVPAVRAEETRKLSTPTAVEVTPEKKPATAPAPSERPKAAAPVAAVEVATSHAEPQRAPIRLQRVARRYGLSPGHTYSRTVKTDEGSELTLFGVSSSRGRSVALINGGVVGEGEEIDGFTVVRIAFGKVELSYRDVTVFLAMQ